METNTSDNKGITQNHIILFASLPMEEQSRVAEECGAYAEHFVEALYRAIGRLTSNA